MAILGSGVTALAALDSGLLEKSRRSRPVPSANRFDGGNEDLGDVRALVRLIIWTVVLLGAIGVVLYGLGHFVFRM